MYGVAMAIPDTLVVMTFTDPSRTGGTRSVEGEWQNEPDKATWVDPMTDLDCMVIRNHMGVWCGYVGLPPGHRWHGQDYGHIDRHVDVHGGLTFAGPCAADHDPTRICHVPQPGRPDNVWWLGFDCGHAFDLHPGFLALRERLPGFREIHEKLAEHETYRNYQFVVAETTMLAQQIARNDARP